MVTFPLLGTKADIQDKLAFDPTRAKRRVLYPEVLELFKDYAVYIGGSSSFDFSQKQFNKYDAVMRYAKENGYEKQDILFVGDDFGDGGGDSHIRIFGLDYVEITDYTTLKDKLAKYL
jgi:hydroxymethylpyrimidine pyrophosphatase-like HAD family hydrolase